MADTVVISPPLLTAWLTPSRVLCSVLLSTGAVSAFAEDRDVVDALAAADRKDTAALVDDSSRMQDSVLNMYPDYLRLNLDLVQQPPQLIVGFAKRHFGSALAEKLAADYAEVRAKAGDYAAVRQVASFVSNPDLSEQCALAQAQSDGGDPLALSSLREQVWLTVGKQPSLCDGVIAQLLRSPMMKRADQEQRLWIMLRAGENLEAADVATVMGLSLTPEQLGRVGSNPDAQLSLPSFDTASDQALYLYALARVADRSVTAAAQIHQARASQLPASVRQYGYRILAMETTGSSVVSDGFDSRTVGWFDQSVGYPFSDEEAEAYARHAVRMGEWTSVLKALDHMSFNVQQKRDWQYWFARASEQRNDPNAKSIAQNFYRSLATDSDYYGLLARDRLGIKTSKLDPIYVPTAEDRARMEQDANFKRAFILRDLAVPAAWANREWNWAVRMASLKNDDALILAAAEKADRMDWHDRAIYATEKTTKLFNDLVRYPTPYRDQVVRYSNNVSLDPAWAYGLMRQESRFVRNARSGVGAGGLMQIMPATGRWIAGRLGEGFSQTRLTEMDTNIRYGTFYLSHVLNQLDDQPVLATAGYNAGPTRAKRWQPLNAPLSADQYTESIPFLETRDYVKNVMTNAVHYGVLFGQGPQSIGMRMGTIAPQSSSGITGP